MKKVFASLLISIAALSGCATSNYSVGTDFSVEKASEIVKGETTTSQLVSLLGEPYSKHVLSKTQEKWMYFYSAGSAKAQSYIVTMDVKTSGTQKTLDVLIEDGIVVNYTLSQNNNPGTVTVN
tara:strand:+ start:653 stop:1021 length:369 start_codon:yes stop_codon:yes gene_type:complete